MCYVLVCVCVCIHIHVHICIRVLRVYSEWGGGGARGYVSFFFFLYFLLTKFDCPSRATVVYWFTVFLEEGRVSVRVLSVSFPFITFFVLSFSSLLLSRTSRGFFVSFP